MKTALHLRLMTHADLPFAHTLRGLAGWNQKIQHWEQLLACDPSGCFVAEWNGSPVGTVTTTRYGSDLAWIGMLLVHPDNRGHGIGKALLQRALDQLNGVSSVKLDATPQGQPLYEKIGFKPEWALTRWETKGIDPNDPLLADDAEGALVPPSQAIESSVTSTNGTRTRTSRIPRTMTRDDLPSITTLDARAFGASRKRLLEFWAASHLTSLVLGMESDGIQGYGLLRDGSKACYLGPVVATSPPDGLSLVKALIASAEARPIYWDIPDDNALVVEFAKQLGFTPQRHLLRMFLGSNETPGIPSQCAAIGDPSIG